MRVAAATDAGFLLLPAFVQSTGIDRSKIQIETIDLAVREAALAQERVDAVTGFDSTTLFNLARVDVPREVERLTWLLSHQVVSEESKRLGLGTLAPARFARGIDQVARAMELPRKPAAAELRTDKCLPAPAARQI